MRKGERVHLRRSLFPQKPPSSKPLHSIHSTKVCKNLKLILSNPHLKVWMNDGRASRYEEQV